MAFDNFESMSVIMLAASCRDWAGMYTNYGKYREGVSTLLIIRVC